MTLPIAPPPPMPPPRITREAPPRRSTGSGGRIRGDWRRDWGRLALAIGSYLIAYGLWRATGWGNAQHFTLIADVAFFPLQITGSVLAWRASRAPSLDERSRRAWRLIGLAVFALWAGSTASSLYEITGHRVEGLLWPDLLSLSADPLWIAALLSFPTAPRTRTERAKFWLDFAVVAVGAAMVTWYILIRPAALLPHGTVEDAVVTIGYPVGDLVTLLALAVVLLRTPAEESRRPLRFVASGMLLGIFADAVYGYLRLSDSYHSGSALDWLWLLSGITYWVAAQSQWLEASRPPARRAERTGPKVTFSLLPYGFIVVGYGMLLLVSADEWSSPHSFVIGGAVTLTALVVLRQIVAQRDNARLWEERVSQEARFRSLVQHSSDVTTVVAEDGVISYLSPSVTAVFGYEPNALLGQSLGEILHPDDASRVDAYLAQCAGHTSESAPAVVWRIRHRDGSWRQVESVGNSLLDDPVLRGIVLNIRDLSERTALEEQLRQAQKMEAVGRLAGGIAHDFNNLLAAIKSNAQLLQMALSPGDERHADVTEIVQATDRASALTRQLLAFSRKQVTQPTQLDMNEVISGMEPILRRLIAKNMVLDVRCTSHIGLVLADAGQLEQVIMNLAVNARDAMPPRGTLTIETGEVAEAPRGARGADSAYPGPWVTLAVRDTGSGIDEETRAHLFEPFFTTKERGAGTGLGLSTVYGIVTQAGGRIGLTSARGQGSTFTVYLPRTGEPQRARRSRRRREERTEGGPETVLLAEDESGVRTAVRRLLERRGYTVLAAESGPEALSLAATHPGAIDLLITDMVMPQMTGLELIQRVQQLRPDLKAICMSGHIDEAAARREMSMSSCVFVAKPFANEELARAVRETLDNEEE